MRINPGGRLDLEDIVGRDSEITRYWMILERQSLALSAERRIGKTHIAIKMRECTRPDFLPFYQDLEGVHSIRELLRSIYASVERSLSASNRWKARLAKWATLLPQRMGGLDLTTLTAAWPTLLATVFDDLSELAGEQTILMMWDEFPLMIYNISKREGESAAIELLDHLRALRQRHFRKIRFLLTGSIGLHLVIRSLQRAGNANDPTNDLYSATVPEMSQPETIALATALLEEIDTDPAHIQPIARSMSQKIGGFPYYIHHVVDQLQQLNCRVSVADVDKAIDALIYDSQDPANFRYYVSRISTYYDPADQAIAYAILDSICRHEHPADVDQIANLVRHRIPSASDEQIRGVLHLLVIDHYLEKERISDKMGYRFRWTLVKRWWQEARR
ncbi:MAG TPA: hypothetical protein VFX20_19915 [Steroidobacteraceae bacterium]|nr:hypothetical protein [Steroidobacteraceae bacterium]